MVTNVVRNKTSPHDPRSKQELKKGGMMGGDRMLHHGYASLYSSYLLPFIQQENRPLTICEFGILKGTGLAIWCDLFPKSRCIGFDIDLGHYKANIENLRSLGAFSANSPEVHDYDQFVYSAEFIGNVLNGDKIDICIDDGCHSEKTILTTIESVLPHVNERFVYFVEDNKSIWEMIKSLYPQFVVNSHCELTVIKNKEANSSEPVE